MLRRLDLVREGDSDQYSRLLWRSTLMRCLVGLVGYFRQEHF